MSQESQSLGRPIGRRKERGVLLETLEEDGPLGVFVHGLAGVGKSTLLSMFVKEARASGAQVVRLDCRSFEPTKEGFLDALTEALGSSVGGVSGAVSTLGRLGPRVVLVLDTYEVFRLSDAWLRSTLVPKFDDRVRVVIAGREPPLFAWFHARGDPTRFRAVRLGTLDEKHALEVLRMAGVAESDARAVNRVARGHPLALQVAAVALRAQPHLRVEEAGISPIVAELTKLYLDHLDARERRFLDAAAVIRRVTVPLLAAMLPDLPAAEGLDRLSSLTFVEEGPDGLRIHETVQVAIATRLRSRDPEAHRRYRMAAWRALQREVRQATRSELWRYTADLLYLLENPAVREAFFPTTAHLHAVEPAGADDGGPIREIAERYEPPEAVAVLDEWWQECPSSFRIARDRAGAVVGFTAVVDSGALPYRIVRADPVVAASRTVCRSLGNTGFFLLLGTCPLGTRLHMHVAGLRGRLCGRLAGSASCR